MEDLSGYVKVAKEPHATLAVTSIIPKLKCPKKKIGIALNAQNHDSSHIFYQSIFT